MNSTQGAVGRDKAMSFVLAALVTVMLLAAGESARADTTFTVNSTADPGTGGCDATECTLREAIAAANSAAGADTIKFNIPGVGVKTISPVSELPVITEAVTIDGYTQPGAKKNTLAKGTDAVLMIELNGELMASGGTGVEIRGSNSVVRGLVINRFFRGIGIVRTIGGPELTGNKIEGNFIGTNVLGTADRGNADGGVFIGEGTNNTIGGAAPEARNLISGNGDAGVRIITESAGNKVQGNLIGTDKDGTRGLPNGSQGVFISGASGNSVGGTSPGTANTIAFNGFEGVVVLNGVNNRIISNSIFSNGGLGIDLIGGNENAANATTNDGDDPATPQPDPDKDTGSNNLQNKPNLTSAKSSASATTIKGRLISTPATTFKIQLFSNPSDTNEGKKFLGQIIVATGPDGLATFAFSPAQRVAVGHTITATATDPEGNTSEFSAPEAVVAR